MFRREGKLIRLSQSRVIRDALQARRIDRGHRRSKGNSRLAALTVYIQPQDQFRSDLALLRWISGILLRNAMEKLFSSVRANERAKCYLPESPKHMQRCESFEIAGTKV